VRPVFDLYGVSPSFYMEGSDQTLTWFGCICTLLLLGCLAGVTLYYFVILMRDENLTVYSKVENSEQYRFVDLQQRKMIVVIRPEYGFQNRYPG
jgi:hypothetical protein